MNLNSRQDLKYHQPPSQQKHWQLQQLNCALLALARPLINSVTMSCPSSSRDDKRSADRYKRDDKRADDRYKEDRYNRDEKNDERAVERSKERSKDRRMKTRSDKRPSRKDDRKVLVTDESTKSCADTDSESSSSSSSSSDSEQEEFHCFMADQTSDDENSPKLSDNGKAGIGFSKPESSKPSWLKNRLDKDKAKAGRNPFVPNQPWRNSTKVKSGWTKTQLRRDLSGQKMKSKLNRSHSNYAQTLKDTYTGKTVKGESSSSRPLPPPADQIRDSGNAGGRTPDFDQRFEMAQRNIMERVMDVDRRESLLQAERDRERRRSEFSGSKRRRRH
ncbi:hypothetical protein F511_19992 [Dorcoceras hygrometricum]|uniref:Uncharacterized protein n=1 Tax=Dorcoceras hygrometricum TaxID=472368 RepID=A0A2Z7AH52_9LAMI|nr:hypothetical protein F511_19992 [Dorcoceras hygrometricum]